VLFFVLGLQLTAQRGIRIGYIDTEYILENVDDYKTANQQLDLKAQKWKGEIEKQLTVINDLKQQLENERILLTNELIKDREEDIDVLEEELLDYQQNRFGPNGDLIIQKKQLMQPIQDQIFAAVQQLATTKKYDFIFDKSVDDVVMLYSADKYDISEQVLRTLNRASKRKQLETKKEKRAAKKENTVVEIGPEKEERQQQLELKKEEQEKIVEEREKARQDAKNKRLTDAENKRKERETALAEKRKKQQEAREARLKELAERRQKLLEDRKAREEAREKAKNENKDN
jgi:Skp family chaperone for outer membrane proteins